MRRHLSIPIRADPEFNKELRAMQSDRILKSRKDNALKPTKIARLTLAITRHKNFQEMKKDIINADLP